MKSTSIENLLIPRSPSPTLRLYRSYRFLKCLAFKLFLVSLLAALIVLLLKDLTTSPFFNPKEQQFQVNFKNIRMAYWMDTPSSRNPGCGDDTKLLILIMSSREGFARRQNVRQTWLKDAIPGMVTKFLLADPAGNITQENFVDFAVQQRALEEEQHQLKDLIFIRGFADTYANLHLKWLAALHWQQAFCGQAKWILKTDDDTIVHLGRLQHWVQRKLRFELPPNGAAYFGWIISGVGPIRDPKNKWFVSSSAYSPDSYPPYMQGATYLASRKAIALVLEHTSEVVGFNMDDVLFTGILALRANVTLVDHKDMFHVGNQIYVHESCEGGVPHVTAIYGVDTRQEYEKSYAKLKAVQANCTEPAERKAEFLTKTTVEYSLHLN